MISTKEGYKLQKRIKDGKFSIDNLHNYHLTLQLGKRDFQLCVTNTQDNRVLLFEDYIFRESHTTPDKIKLLESIWESHHVLMAGFWKSISFTSKSQKFSLVPSQLFLKENTKDYVSLNSPLEETDEVYYNKLIKTPVVVLFAEDRRLTDFIQSFYPAKKVHIVHNSSALIEGVLHTSGQTPETRLFVHIDRFYLQIIALNGKKLYFYNQFRIKHFEDYLKYISSVLKGLEIKADQAPLVSWGHLKKGSKHFMALQQKVPNLSFGIRPKQLSFGYMFDEIQDHSYFDVFSSYFCQ